MDQDYDADLDAGDGEEIRIFNDAIIYRRGEHWQFRLWLKRENKYARKSLNTRNRATAIERGRDFYLDGFELQLAGFRPWFRCHRIY